MIASAAQPPQPLWESSPILSDSKWESLFSVDLYRRVGKKDPTLSTAEKNSVLQHSLKFLLAQNRSDEIILKQIETLKTKHTDEIESTFSQYRITVLHIAIMKGRKVVVERLIESGAKVNAVDEYGWACLHHAAIVSDALVDLLLRNGADPAARTKLDGTYQNIKELAKIKRASVQPFCSYQSWGSLELEKLSHAILAERLKIDYIQESYWPSNLLYDFWTSRPELEKGRSFNQVQIRTKLYPQLTEKPPQVIIREEKHSNSPILFFGIIAGQFIPPLTLIGEYTGRITKMNKEQQLGELTYSYILEEESEHIISVDAQEEGNWTRYMNEGFPNVVPFDLFNTAGQKCRRIFFCADSEGIKSGESMQYDYTWHYYTLKWGRYTLLEKEKLRKFYHSFFQHYQFLLDLERRMQERPKGEHIAIHQIVEYRALETRLQYPFSTPMVLMDLAFSETINPSDWADFMKKEEKKQKGLLERLIIDDNPDHKKVLGLLFDLGGFNFCIKKLIHCPQGFAQAQKIRRLFLEHEDILTVPELITKLRDLLGFFEFIELNVNIDFTEEEIIALCMQIDTEVSKLFPQISC